MLSTVPSTSALRSAPRSARRLPTALICGSQSSKRTLVVLTVNFGVPCAAKPLIIL
jgi:hypothetical protein